MISRFFKKTLIAACASVLLTGSFSASASAETRTLSLYFPHTKENLTVTYKKNGRYIASALKKLNWFFRDWRRDKATKMDPVTIDLLWELYKDLGAKKPVHVVSGYRSRTTNSMLRRVGRKVARHSQHIRGKAIDVYFPDVPTSRLRGSALARKIGGVGYYPRSGKHGFVHIDSGTVRHWPRMSPLRLASVIKAHRYTIGARLKRPSQPATRLASAGPVNIVPGNKKAVRIPVPRPRPLAVAMAAAAADTYIVPVSAPGGKQNFSQPSSLIKGDGIGALLASTSLDNNGAMVQRTNKSGKSSFAGLVQAGTAKNVPLLKPLNTAYASHEFWWSGDMNKLIRRDGAPQPFVLGDKAGAGSSDTALSGEDKSALETMIAALTGKLTTGEIKKAPVLRVARAGKSDSLVVNRSAKRDMFSTRPTRGLNSRIIRPSDKLAGSFEAILRSADKPIGFSQ